MRIAFLCAPAAHDAWTPRDVESGLGGSEEAVIHMAAALAARGHRVSVHNAASATPERFGDVIYGDYEALRGEAIDIAIVWRRPGLLGRFGFVKARSAFLWLHDLIEQDSVLREAHRYRKVMVLSRFHRSHYPRLDPRVCLTTSNGIDPAQFRYRPRRDPHLMVYGSAYVRGLRTLLDRWPSIRRAVPDARLHVFYGWESLRHVNPLRAARLKPLFERLMTQPGIVHFGRIGHRAVARQYASAGVWAYPCSFGETSCMSAMKAQAAGAVPAVIPTGALRETVRFGFATMRGYTDFIGMPMPSRVIDEWCEGLIALLLDASAQERVRATMMPKCLDRFAWSRVADAWEREFASA